MSSMLSLHDKFEAAAAAGQCQACPASDLDTRKESGVETEITEFVVRCRALSTQGYPISAHDLCGIELANFES